MFSYFFPLFYKQNAVLSSTILLTATAVRVWGTRYDVVCASNSFRAFVWPWNLGLSLLDRHGICAARR